MIALYSDHVTDLSSQMTHPLLYTFFTLCATLNKHLPPIYSAVLVFIFRFLFKITTHSYM